MEAFRALTHSSQGSSEKGGIQRSRGSAERSEENRAYLEEPSAPFFLREGR